MSREDSSGGESLEIEICRCCALRKRLFSFRVRRFNFRMSTFSSASSIGDCLPHTSLESQLFRAPPEMARFHHRNADQISFENIPPVAKCQGPEELASSAVPGHASATAAKTVTETQCRCSRCFVRILILVSMSWGGRLLRIWSY